MNKLLKKSLAFLLALVMVLSVLPVFEVSATTVEYETGYSEEYGAVTKNWGKRGELATFLSPNAEKFYSENGFDYDDYISMKGSSNTSTVTSSTLYNALYELMDDAHTTITKYDKLKDVFAHTDCENNGYTSSVISSFYSGIALKPEWNSAIWNREHTWAQSMSSHKGDERDDTADIMSLRAETQSVNSSRGNAAFGAGTGYYDPNIGAYNVHGDVARVILYTYVRWGAEDAVLQDNMWGSTGVFESVEVLLDWMEEDPVDTWEMGRNDSVESITGTRNVFVDYPELAFVLFGAEIPEMDTPSGEADSVSYTITAQTNNATYGTVSVNNSYITAHPAKGYKATGYQVISGNATVTQNGNIFTVSATKDCTVRINFAAKTQYTATFMADGKTASTQTVYEDYCVTMPAFSGAAPEGYTFRGWVDSIVYNTAAKPATVYAAGSEYILDGNTTFYALMSYENKNDTSGSNLTYKLVTSASQLSEGISVVITAADANYALSTTQNTNNRGAVEVTKDGDKLVFDSDYVQALTLVNGTIDGTYGLSTGNRYLCAASNTSNYLKETATLNDNGSFMITVNEDGTHSVIAQGTNSKNTLLFNSQSNLFSCYGGISSNVKKICVYYGVSGGATYYTTAWTYVPTDPEETEPATTEPEVTEPVVSGGYELATDISLGDRVILVTQKANMELSGISTTSTKYGLGAAYTDVPAGCMVLTVVKGSAANTYAFRNGDGKYLTWTSGNSLNVGAELNNNTSWTVSFDSDANALIQNAADATREIWWNVTSPRFACYTNKTAGTGYYATQFYKYVEAEEPECDHEYREFERTEATCTESGSISYGCPCGDVYTEQIPALGHTEVVDAAVAATYTKTGLTEGKRCSVCGEVTVAQKEIPVLANPVAEYNVSLSDNIGVNFVMNLNASDVVVVTANGVAVDVQIVDGKFSIELAAAQMTDEIAITVNGLPLGKTYSVRKYADEILAGNYSDAAKNLVKFMLNYGGAAQTHFGYNTSSMANTDITVDTAEVPAAAETEFTVSGSADGITFYGASLVYRDKIAIRFYFVGDAAEIEGAVVKGDMFYIEKAGILPQDYDQAVTVEVGGLIVSYSPMNYIVRMYNKADAADSTKALVKALYNYYLAAEAYIG